MPSIRTVGNLYFEIYTHYVTVYKFDSFSQKYCKHYQCTLEQAKTKYPEIFIDKDTLEPIIEDLVKLTMTSHKLSSD